MAWGIRAGALHKVYNWYGIPQEQFINVALNDMSDVHQRYLGAEVGAKVEFEDAIFESAELLVNGMWDRNLVVTKLDLFLNLNLVFHLQTKTYN